MGHPIVGEDWELDCRPGNNSSPTGRLVFWRKTYCQSEIDVIYLHSDRPEHLLSKEALVKQATSLRGLCEAHVHLGLGEE